MGKRSRKKSSKKITFFFILGFIVFIYCVLLLRYNKDNINKYIQLYIVIYGMFMSYFLFNLYKKLTNIYDRFWYKILVSMILIICNYFIIDALINVFKFPIDSIINTIYTIYLVLLIFSLLLFDYATFIMDNKKKKSKRRRKK